MNEVNYINLIQKQLSDEISAEELMQLNEWIDRSDSNQKTYNSIKEIWNNSSYLAPEFDVDLDDEFELLNNRIEASEENKTKVIPLKWKALSVAAGIAIIFTLVNFWDTSNGVNENAEYATLMTSNEMKEIVLADGSMIHLNANSSFTYPLSFNQDKREVQLKGEGFFEVAKDKNHPFIIHTGYEDVTVLGTSFNVRAYPNEGASEISVSKGKVSVTNGLNEQILLPNQKAIVTRDSKKIIFETSASLNETAWHTGTISFTDAMVPEVFSDLEDYYNIHFNYDKSKLKNCHFTSTFVNEDLSTVLVTISTVLNVSIEPQENDTYLLVGGGCQ